MNALEIHLIIEAHEPDKATQSHPQRPLVLVLPEEPSYLACDGAGTPSIVSDGESVESAATSFVPVRNRERRPHLLVCSDGREVVRVNGSLAPRVVLVKERDVLQWGVGFQAHIALFGRPRHGPAPDHWIGRECQHCRVQFSDAVRCLVCPWCETPLHDSDMPSGLRCAQERSTCPGCSRAVLHEPGYASYPNFEQ